MGNIWASLTAILYTIFPSLEPYDPNAPWESYTLAWYPNNECNESGWDNWSGFFNYCYTDGIHTMEGNIITI